MSEDEITVEADERAGVGSGDARRPHDDAAESFLELDADLDRSRDPGADSGLVVDAERVPRARVPDGYPLGTHTEAVLELTVDTGLDERSVYLSWPDDATDVPLVWYLDANGIELRELYGREVDLRQESGHTTLATPDEAPRGSERWQLGVVGGYALTAGLVGLMPFVGTAVGSPHHLLWAALTLVGLPYAVYRDAWYLRTHSDWDGGPLFWATLSALPFLNLVTVAGYLYSRSKARFFGTETSLRTRVVSAVRSLL